MILSQSIITNRSAADALQYYADFSRHKEFIGLLENTKIEDTSNFGLGSEFVEEGDMIIGGKLSMRSKITKFDLEKDLQITCISIDGGNEIEQDFKVQPMDNDSCKITYTTRVTQPAGLSVLKMASGALSPFLKAKVKRQMEKDMRKFKDILEGGYDKR